jgi:hypothetical protein
MKRNIAVKELIELGQQIIGHLMKDQSIDWFVDANVLQSGFVEREFGTLANVFTTEEIVSELNKRPEESKSGLRVVSQLGASNRIASETWFSGALESFNLLMDAATQLAPSIRVRTLHIMETELMSQEIAEEKAIQQLANEGDFFASKILSFIEELQFAEDDVKSRFKSTRRSWFRQPAKRRGKIREDDFLQSDERLSPGPFVRDVHALFALGSCGDNDSININGGLFKKRFVLLFPNVGSGFVDSFH